MTDQKSLEEMAEEIVRCREHLFIDDGRTLKTEILDALRLAQREGLELAAEMVEKDLWKATGQLTEAELWLANRIRARAKELA